MALLLTKFDRVLARGDGLDSVERVVEARYGMTRHALARHVPNGAMFAVSSYGRGSVDGRPPAELAPLGLEGPLGWIAEQLEEVDRNQLEWLWDLAPADLTRLARCVAAFEKRYPRSDRSADFRRRLREGRRRRTRRGWSASSRSGRCVAAGLAGYDAWAFRSALQFEAGNAAPDVARRWDDLARWHPTLPYFWPGEARIARAKQAEWTVKAAQARQDAGTAAPDSRGSSPRSRSATPTSPRRSARSRRPRPWPGRKRAGTRSRPRPPRRATCPTSPSRRSAGSSASTPTPAPRRGRRPARLAPGAGRVEARRARAAGRRRPRPRRQAPRGEPPRPDRAGPPVRRRAPRQPPPPRGGQLLDGFVKTLDDRDIDKARDFSKRNPTEFARRIDRYNDYLQAHKNGGRFISEATEAKDRILRGWDTDTYRRAYDHLAAHPNDIAEVARQLRDYLAQHPEGRRVAEARRYLEWWDKVSVPNDYQRHPPLRRVRPQASARPSAAPPTSASPSRSPAPPTAPRP